MSKDKAWLKTKHGFRSTLVDIQAVKAYWLKLPASDKRHVLEFKDPDLVECLFMIWQTLSISDVTCYACGIPTVDTDSKKACNDFFAIHGYISPDGALHDAAFYARPPLTDNSAFFDIIEQRLGSSLLDGRLQLSRSKWPTLFTTSPNSWSAFLCKLFNLVELAVCTAHAGACSPNSVSLELCMVSCSAKRRARKKRVNLKMRAEEHDMQSIADICAVCDGTGLLFSDSCPLCADDTDGVEAPNSIFELEEKSHTQSPQVPELINFKSTPEACASNWSSRWKFAGRGSQVDWQWIISEEDKASSGICASVKNTFIHASLFRVQCGGLSHSRSMPSFSS